MKPSPRTAMARRKKLADFLRKLPERKFDFSAFVTTSRGECGTVCCAAGWMPKVFKAWKWKNDDSCSGLVVQSPGQKETQWFLDDDLFDYFGLTDNEGWMTFYESYEPIHKAVTPTQVADRLMAWPRPKE